MTKDDPNGAKTDANPDKKPPVPASHGPSGFRIRSGNALKPPQSSETWPLRSSFAMPR